MYAGIKSFCPGGVAFLPFNGDLVVLYFRSQRKGANPKAMENVIIQNRLECKICLSTYRLFYVEDTEDFFYRRRGSPRYRPNPKQIEKFRKWHNTFQEQNL